MNGKPHIFTNSKHLALLAYLLMDAGEYRRDQLTRFVWSSGASGSIDTALSELRAVFGPEVIPPRTRKIALSRELVEVDALRLLSATDDPASRTAAIDLYRGPFLENFNQRGSSETFVRWVERTRAKLEEAFREVCDEVCRSAASEGNWPRVLEVAETGIRKSPGWSAGEQWREAAAQALRPQPMVQEEAEERVVDEPVAKEADPPALVAGAPQGRPSHRVFLALAGLTAVLIFLVVLAIREWRSPESLVRMPPIRADQLPAPGSPIRTLSDWLRTDGQWIYYRYERYMPAACQHETRAVGNFGRNGWTRGIPVACLNAAWLAVDGERLIRRFSLAPETTYCLQFLYTENQTAFWSQHGPENAPGLESIRVVAPAGEYNIGFAVLRSGPGKRYIELTHRYPASRC
ncbi:AfsR/SARP family transcriptional regulator [Longimicrobium sp.]|uniref:AfsR/SARP family transcriptional regulator n=1 Tax=Longimicrobium sp. TaxID=2029185 RepID=UPI003B3AA501